MKVELTRIYRACETVTFIADAPGMAIIVTGADSELEALKKKLNEMTSARALVDDELCVGECVRVIGPDFTDRRGEIVEVSIKEAPRPYCVHFKDSGWKGWFGAYELQRLSKFKLGEYVVTQSESMRWQVQEIILRADNTCRYRCRGEGMGGPVIIFNEEALALV